MYSRALYSYIHIGLWKEYTQGVVILKYPKHLLALCHEGMLPYSLVLSMGSRLGTTYVHVEWLPLHHESELKTLLWPGLVLEYMYT